jgi:hypothetical protein
VNWDAIGAVSELVGAIAVVVTIGYLALQVRNSRLSADIAAVAQANRDWSDRSAPLIDPQVAELFLKGRESYENLSEIEKVQFTEIMSGRFLVLENMFLSVDRKIGVVGEDATRAIIQLEMEGLGVREWWQITREYYSPRFQKWVQEICAGADA